MTPEELQKRLSLNIKKARKKLSLSQEKLSEKAQISVQMMNDIEGCRRWPSEKTLVKLANALEVDVGFLFQSEEKNEQLNPIQKQKVVTELYELFSESIKQYLSN